MRHGWLLFSLLLAAPMIAMGPEVAEAKDKGGAAAKSPTRLMDALRAFLDGRKMQFREHETAPALVVPLVEQGRGWQMVMAVREDQEQYTFYSVFPMNAAPETRSQVMEFITRANYGLIIGNFELDLDDGEVRYKTSVDVENVSITTPLLLPLLGANVQTFRRYFDGIEAVMKGEKSAEQAITEIEG